MSNVIRNELFFHLVFVGVFVAFTAVRAIYQRAASQTQGKYGPHRPVFAACCLEVAGSLSTFQPIADVLTG